MSSRTPIRLLLVEDSEDDAELILAALGQEGIMADCTRVERLDRLKAALGNRQWDAAVSDFSLPGLDAWDSLRAVQEAGLDIPFLVVSGCIGEETAVKLMKAGAHDVIMKDNLLRLAPAIEREMRDAAVRRERSAAEEALRKSEKLLRKMTSALGEGIMVLDRHCSLRFVNPEAERLLGRPASDLLNRSMEELVYAPDGSRACLTEWVPKANAYRTDEQYFLRADGTRFPVSLVATPIREGEAITAYVVAFQDITERRMAEEELKQSRRQLRELSAFLQCVREEERTRIARELHDELGQILTALKFDLAWLTDRIPAEHEALIDKTSAMSDLVDTTVDAVRRIASDLRPGMLDDLGLAAAIEWLVEEFSKRTGIECSLIMGGDEFEIADDRATAVFRILQESLTNVARHAQASQLKVSVHDNNAELTVEVCDNGVGIRNANGADPHDRRPSRKTYGLLGMKERAHSLGGRLMVRGAPGAGTVIQVTVPKFEDEGTASHD